MASGVALGVCYSEGVLTGIRAVSQFCDTTAGVEAVGHEVMRLRQAWHGPNESDKGHI